MTNVVDIQDSMLMKAQQAWERINNYSKRLREDWLTVGEYLLTLRKQYPSNQDFGQEARKVFKDMAKEHRSAAIWWAELSPLNRSLCAEMWPDINHPQAIRRAYNEMKADNPDFDEPESGYNIPTPVISPSPPENVEIPDESPEISPDEPVENESKEVHSVSEQNIKRSPLTPFVGPAGAASIFRFFTSRQTRVAINKCALDSNRKNLKELASLIESGKIGQSNTIALGPKDRDRINARCVHQELTPPFSNQFSFKPSDAKGFKRLLDAAPLLYQIGEQVKHIESLKERSFQAEKLYREMTAPTRQSSSANPPVSVAPVLSRELQTGEQTIKVCGKTYWPPNEYAATDLTYKIVWGAAEMVHSLYVMLTTRGEPPADAATSLMMMSRAQRLINQNAGNLFNSMASRMKDHPEWIEDTQQSNWPVNSGMPEGY